MLTAMSTFWQRHIVGTKPVDPRILRASSPNSSKFRSPLFGRSRFTLSSKACVFLGIVGAFAGTSSGSSSALAEAEDNVGQQIADPGYSVSNLSNGTLTNLLINKVLGQGPIDYSAIYAKYGNRFPAGDEWDVIREPLPSGLLGPVRLHFYKLVKI